MGMMFLIARIQIEKWCVLSDGDMGEPGGMMWCMRCYAFIMVACFDCVFVDMLVEKYVLLGPLRRLAYYKRANCVCRGYCKP